MTDKLFEDAGELLIAELLWAQIDDDAVNWHTWFTVEWFDENVLPMVHKAVKKRNSNSRKDTMVSSLNCLRVLRNGGAIESVRVKYIRDAEGTLLSTAQQMKISDGEEIRVARRRLKVGPWLNSELLYNSVRTNRYHNHLQDFLNGLLRFIGQNGHKYIEEEGGE